MPNKTDHPSRPPGGRARSRNASTTNPRPPRPQRFTPQSLRGTLRVAPGGFGFLDCDDGPSVFITPQDIEGLLDGDLLDVVPTADSLRPRAESVRLARRGNRAVCATVTADPAVVVPDPFLAHGTWHIGENKCSAPLAEGDLVVGTTHRGKMKVTSYVPATDRPAQLRTRALVRFELPLCDLQDAPLPKRAPLGATRRDLRDVLTLTIDADHSEDLDDALSVFEADSDGSVRVMVHIADVAEHIPAGSALDDAAVDVATSIYFPSWRRPMLPRNLSEGALSLLPGAERDALTVEYRITPEGVVTDVECFESRIRSDLRLSYDMTAAMLSFKPVDLSDRLCDHPDPKSTAQAVATAVQWLRTAAARLDVQRRRRGGLTSRRGDPELVVDDNGVPADLAEHREVPADSGPSAAAHALIERLMVATNEAVAGWLGERNLPGVFRVHDGPDAEGVAQLVEFCEQLGVHCGFGEHLTPLALSALEEQFTLAGDEADSSGAWEVLMSAMRPARYATQPGLHFGLASQGYVHFTSPIRRYADLCVHRIIKAHLAGEDPTDSLHWDLEATVEHINSASAAAARAESQLRRMLWLEILAALPMSQRLNGHVISVGDRDLRVKVDRTAVWAKARYSSLHGRWDKTKVGQVQGPNGVVAVGETVQLSFESVVPEACECLVTFGGKRKGAGSKNKQASNRNGRRKPANSSNSNKAGSKNKQSNSKPAQAKTSRAKRPHNKSRKGSPRHPNATSKGN